jgi:hypothetical protein
MRFARNSFSGIREQPPAISTVISQHETLLR